MDILYEGGLIPPPVPPPTLTTTASSAIQIHGFFTTMRNSAKPIALALMLVVSAVAAGGAAALSVDTETVDTTATSDLTETSTITDAHNDSVAQTIRIVGDTATQNSGLANPEEAMTLEFVVNETNHVQDGMTVYESADTWGVDTVSSAPDQYNTTVTNADITNDLTYGATETVTVDARVTFNESETDESVTNITFEIAPEGSNARLAPGADMTTVENRTFFGVNTASLPFLGGGGGDQAGAAQLSQSVAVADTTDEIAVSVASDSATDAFAEVADAGSAGSLSTMGVVNVNGHLTPLFVESADAEWLDTESDAYATLASDGDEITVHNANQTYDAGTSSVDVRVTGNDEIGAMNAFSMLGSYDAGWGARAGAAAGSIGFNTFDEL